MVSYTTELLTLGNNVGIKVPEDIVLGFGVGKRVPVIVRIAGYSYLSTTAVMSGKYLLPLAAADVRAAFDALAPSKRKEHVRQVTSAKAEETRDRRIAKIVDSLR